MPGRIRNPAARITVVAGFVLLAAGCDSGGVDEPDAQLSLVRVDSIHLHENLYQFDGINSVSFFPDGNGVVSSEGAGLLVKYSSNWTQERLIGAEGVGPGQYERLGPVDVVGDSVFVWDGAKTRMMVFDSQGRLLETTPSSGSSTTDFHADGADVIRYLRQHPYEFVVRSSLTNLDEPDFTTGRAGLRHLALMTYVGSGKIAGDGGSVWYTSADETVLHRIDTVTGETDSVLFTDPDFELMAFGPYESIDEMTGNFGDVLPFIQRSSLVVGVHPLGSRLLVEIEHGRHDSEVNNRTTRLHVFSKDLEQDGSVLLDSAFRERFGYRIVGTHHDVLYMAREHPTTDGTDLIWVMTGFRVEEAG